MTDGRQGHVPPGVGTGGGSRVLQGLAKGRRWTSGTGRREEPSGLGEQTNLREDVPLASAGRRDRIVSPQPVPGPEPEGPAWQAGGPRYVFHQPYLALLCTRAMTPTSRHRHWNAVEVKGNAGRRQSCCDIGPKSGRGGLTQRGNSLTSLSWHLGQTHSRF